MPSRVWQPPEPLSLPEQLLLSRLEQPRLFHFLRTQRHLLFDEQFQTALGTLDSPDSTAPPACLAMATLMQAYTAKSDAVVVDATLTDRRWQLVLDCWECEEPPFRSEALSAFRHALIALGLQRRLIEHTVAIARQTKGFASLRLHVVLLNSPLWDTKPGAGKLWHAMIGLAARHPGMGKRFSIGTPLEHIPDSETPPGSIIGTQRGKAEYDALQAMARRQVTYDDDKRQD